MRVTLPAAPNSRNRMHRSQSGTTTTTNVNQLFIIPREVDCSGNRGKEPFPGWRNSVIGALFVPARSRRGAKPCSEGCAEWIQLNCLHGEWRRQKQADTCS